MTESDQAPKADVAVRSETYQAATEAFELKWRVAKVIAASKKFPDAGAPEQAMAKILLGEELGLNPMQAMTGIHFMQGRPELAAVQIAAMVRQHPDYDYEVKVHTGERCEIEFTRGKEPIGTSVFTIEDAEKAGLQNSANYKHYPRNMLFARAMTNGQKWLAPDVTRGIAVYDVGEISADAVTAPVGDGTTPDVDLPPEALELALRAEQLGHAAYSDRPSVAMIIGGQSETFIEDWLSRAHADLDRLEARLAAQEPDESQEPEIDDALPLRERLWELSRIEDPTEEERTEHAQIMERLAELGAEVPGQESLL